ncbi:MAG: HEAT repeat domain-containing protein [Pirellulales bacterium]|nr:HEAT repeat domain-containing protein [Pirellulales bacterium]
MHRLYRIMWTRILVVAAVVAVTAIATVGTAEESADLEMTLEELLPGMGAENIADSQDAQQQWERICRGLCVTGMEAQRAEASRLMAAKLGPDTPNPARIWLLRQLEHLGDVECVDAVTDALDDEDVLVRSAARRALTSNPAPEANAKLISKLETLKGDEHTQFKIGLLNSLGHRADRSSTDAAAKALGDANEDVVGAAAEALGKIGTPQAAEALKARRQNSVGELRLRLGNASLRCANKLLAQGKTDTADKIFKDLYHPREPNSVRSAAVHGLIDAAGNNKALAIGLLLPHDDPVIVGVAAARLAELNVNKVKDFSDNLSELRPATQVLVLEAFRVRAEKDVMPGVVAAAGSENQAVRVAALRALATVGDATVIPLLLSVLSEDGEVANEVSRATRDSLVAVYGEGADQKIVAAMQAADDLPQRAALIDVLSRRRSVAAVPALLEEAVHSQADIRRPAMAALSHLAEIDNVPAMVQGVLRSEEGGERDEAEKAIMLLCNRIEDNDKRADSVLTVFDDEDEVDRKALLPLLGRIGGPRALQQIQVALKSDDKDLYEVGVRAICNWPDGAVAGELLEIFESSEEESHRLRAMRAFIRVIALRHERSTAESLALLQKAMELSSRDEERNLILSRASSAEIRSIEALRFVLPYLENQATAEQACRAIVGLSHHRYLRRPNQAEFNKALGEVIRVSKDPELVDQARRYRSDL